MSDSVKLTALDASSLIKYTYNEELRANRVELVGSDSIIVNLDTKPLEEAIKAGFSEYKVTTTGPINPTIEYREIKIPEIVKEVQIIEVPTYITNTEVKIIEVEKTTFVPELKIIEIEKPIYITKIEYVDKIVYQKEIKNLNYLLIIQVILAIGLALKLCIK
jgi:hypothetical protein